MADAFYPSVDTAFIIDQIERSGKILVGSKLVIGSTISFTLDNNQAFHKRFIVIREIEAGAISFENATGIAIRLNFLTPLVKWLHDNKGWKDGGFTLTPA